MKTLRIFLVAVWCVVVGTGVAWAEAGKGEKRAKEGKKPAGPVTAEQMWSQLDSNKDDTVELSELLALKPLKGDENRAKKILQSWDGNGDGKVTKEEFRAFVARQEELRKKQFAKIDANGNGVLDLDEVKALKQGGDDEAKAKALLERLDDNKDGKVTAEEFVRFRNLLQAPAPEKGARKQR